MARLTLSIHDDLLRRARIRAGREGTSVTGMLRARFARYADDDAEVGDADVGDADVGDAEVGQAWDQFLALRPINRGAGRPRRTWRRDDLQREPGSGAPR